MKKRVYSLILSLIALLLAAGANFSWIPPRPGV